MLIIRICLKNLGTISTLFTCDVNPGKFEKENIKVDALWNPNSKQRFRLTKEALLTETTVQTKQLWI